MILFCTSSSLWNPKKTNKDEITEWYKTLHMMGGFPFQSNGDLSQTEGRNKQAPIKNGQINSRLF